MTRTEIITAIEAYAERHNLSPSTVTGRAVNNSRLYARMKDGGDCTTEIAAKLLDFIAGGASEGAQTTGAR